MDPAILNDEQTRVFVGATQICTGEIEFFDSRRPGGLTFEHVVASGSLPPGFPMTEIEGEWYWDGGLFSNTPLSPAINALEEAANGDPSAVRELIVVELFPMNAPIPRTMRGRAAADGSIAVHQSAHARREILRQDRPGR